MIVDVITTIGVGNCAACEPLRRRVLEGGVRRRVAPLRARWDQEGCRDRVPFEDNDLSCLGGITELIVSVINECPPWLGQLATQFQTTEELAAWICSLPQRDDERLPDDGPKVVVCEPWQRLRLPAPDPNCVERAALYVAVAELIDPWPVRRLATLDFDWGRHTFPIEEGEPIVLNPRVSEEDLQQAVPRRKRRIAHVPGHQSEPAASIAGESEPKPAKIKVVVA
jgi:hypothetical protein